MAAAVLAAVGAMMLAAGPLSRLVGDNLTAVMLPLAFLLMSARRSWPRASARISPREGLHAAMSFSTLVEALNLLNLLSRRARAKAVAVAA